MKSGMLWLTFMILLSACSKPDTFEKVLPIHDSFFKGFVKLEKMERINKYKLSITDSLDKPVDCIYTPYEVFQMETGDIDRDGKTDICLGIIKPTPFDSILKKRLFIFNIDRRYIRPLWLSSRLVNPLEEFTIDTNSRKECIIRTIEKEGTNLYGVRSYKWGTFGMIYQTTLQDSIDYEKAQQNLFRH
jgi:hypothetical protein